MGGYLRSNLDALAGIDPDLADELGRTEPCADLKIETGRSGWPSALIQIASGWHRLHSSYDPRREAERLIEANLTGSGWNLALFGLGLGYALAAWSRKAGQDDRLYAVDCRPDIFVRGLEILDLASALADKRIRLLVTGDEGRVLQFIRTLQGQTLPLAIAPFFQAVQPAGGRLGEMLERLRLDSFLPPEVSERLTRNVECNRALVRTSPAINERFGSYAGRSAFLVAAGPSLPKNAVYLAEAARFGVILSASTSLAHLLGLGIRPDLVGLTDSSRHVARHFNGIERTDISLVFLPTASPLALEAHRGPKWVGFQRGHPEVESIAAGRELLDCGGSVATLLLELAVRFGCDPIVLVGQNLAYTGGLTHFQTDEFHDRLWGKSRPVAGLFRDRVESSTQLLRYLRWIETRIGREPGRSFYNATEGGAVIRGAESLSLREVLARLGRKK